MKILDGKKIALEETENLKKEFAFLTSELKRKPLLSIIQVGDYMPSNKYIEFKKKKAAELGVDVKVFKFDQNITKRELMKKLDDINENADGIIIQLPLPEELPSQVILDGVRLEIDIDGLCTRNTFNFYNDKKDFHFTPATPDAIMTLISKYNISLKDKKVSVIGRSNLVGKPTAFIIKKYGAVVTTFNKNTGIKGIENADIVISAAGQPNLVKKENLKPGAIVIDVGSNWIEKDGKAVLCGDVDLTDLDGYIEAIAPVPGGVGPLTVISLFKNLAKAIRYNNQI